MSTCTTCHNTGWSTVPHPDFVEDGFFKPHHRNHLGKPVFYTAAVTCSCHKGTKIREAMERREVPKHKMPISLATYKEKVYFDPQALLDEIWPPAPPVNLGSFKPREEVKRVARQYAEVPD